MDDDIESVSAAKAAPVLASASSVERRSVKKAKKQPNLPNDVICIVLQGYGSVRQMKTISIPRPVPGDGEVLIHVRSW
jgi:hypothetical protein